MQYIHYTIYIIYVIYTLYNIHYICNVYIIQFKVRPLFPISKGTASIPHF